MTGRASRLLGSVWWLFAIATIFFVVLCGVGVWRLVATAPSYTDVADVTSFRTPSSADRPTLHLLLPDDVAGPLAANQFQCRSASGQRWQGSLLDNASATRHGTHWSSVLELPKGWRTGDRITCSGASGPALLAAEDRRPALIMTGVAALGALLAAGFTVAGLMLRRRRRRTAPWAGPGQYG